MLVLELAWDAMNQQTGRQGWQICSSLVMAIMTMLRIIVFSLEGNIG
jgi:hypothetical protein